jgi:hypothetical protein
MFRSLSLSFAASVLIAGLAFAEPELRVTTNDGVPQLVLTASFTGSRYTVTRGASAEGPWTVIREVEALCTGVCYSDDPTARPGRTYWYRFDIERSDGTPVRYGPFAVTIPAPERWFSARAFPNPSRAAARVELFYAGASADPAVPASAVVFDSQGRRVRTLWSGPLATGLTRVEWDGRDDRGRTLDPGHYFLRFGSPRGTTVFRLIRIR